MVIFIYVLHSTQENDKLFSDKENIFGFHQYSTLRWHYDSRFLKRGILDLSQVFIVA